MVVHRILLELAKFGQTLDALGLRDRAGEHDDLGARRDGMDRLNIKRGFHRPALGVLSTPRRCRTEWRAYIHRGERQVEAPAVGVQVRLDRGAAEGFDEHDGLALAGVALLAQRLDAIGDAYLARGIG